MRYAGQVYSFGSSIEDDRPEIDFTLPANAAIDWLAIDDVIRGAGHIKRIISEGTYRPPSVTVLAEDATDWHYYDFCDLLSQCLVDLVRPFAADHFLFLPASLNGKPYLIPKPDNPLDCLDRERSVGRYFPDDPKRAMQIKQYAFREGIIEDPKLFCIPELRGRMYCTESIKRMVEEAGLKGMRFDLLYEFS